jgi:hypothetical protein
MSNPNPIAYAQKQMRDWSANAKASCLKTLADSSNTTRKYMLSSLKALKDQQNEGSGVYCQSTNAIDQFNKAWNPPNGVSQYYKCITTGNLGTKLSWCQASSLKLCNGSCADSSTGQNPWGLIKCLTDTTLSQVLASSALSTYKYNIALEGDYLVSKNVTIPTHAPDGITMYTGGSFKTANPVAKESVLDSTQFIEVVFVKINATNQKNVSPYLKFDDYFYIGVIDGNNKLQKLHRSILNPPQKCVWQTNNFRFKFPQRRWVGGELDGDCDDVLSRSNKLCSNVSSFAEETIFPDDIIIGSSAAPAASPSVDVYSSLAEQYGKVYFKVGFPSPNPLKLKSSDFVQLGMNLPYFEAVYPANVVKFNTPIDSLGRGGIPPGPPFSAARYFMCPPGSTEGNCDGFNQFAACGSGYGIWTSKTITWPCYSQGIPAALSAPQNNLGSMTTGMSMAGKKLGINSTTNNLCVVENPTPSITGTFSITIMPLYQNLSSTIQQSIQEQHSITNSMIGVAKVALTNSQKIFSGSNTGGSSAETTVNPQNLTKMRNFLCVKEDGLPTLAPTTLDKFSTNPCNLETNMNNGFPSFGINIQLFKNYSDSLSHSQQVATAQLGTSATAYKNQVDMICKTIAASSGQAPGSTGASGSYYAAPKCSNGNVVKTNQNVNALISQECTCSGAVSSCNSAMMTETQKNEFCGASERQINRAMANTADYCKYMGAGTNICGGGTSNADPTIDTSIICGQMTKGSSAWKSLKCARYEATTAPAGASKVGNLVPPSADTSTTAPPLTTAPPAGPSLSIGGDVFSGAGTTAPGPSSSTRLAQPTFPPGSKTMWIGIMGGLGGVLLLIAIYYLSQKSQGSDESDDMVPIHAVHFSAF